MTKVVRSPEFGGAETLRLGGNALPYPGPGKVRVRQSFASVNYIDIYHRTGLYPLPQIQAVLGGEGGGTAEAVGPRRSLSLSGPSVFGYMTDVGPYRAAATDFLTQLEQGQVRPSVGAVYPLADASEAHRGLEGRRTTGSILLAA